MRKLCICSAVFWLAIGSLVIVIQISQCHGFNRSRQAFAEEVTSRDFAPAYKSDISKLALSRVSIPISHSLRPVMIYGQNDQEQIFGQGVVFELEGRPVVITCSHLFPKDFGSCNYRIKHYFGGKEEDIAGVKPLYSSDKPDQTYPGLCLALIGSGKTIDGFDVFTDQSSHQGKMYLIDKPWPVQSLLTGKFYMVKGVMDNPRGDRGVVFGYDMPGSSS